MTNDIVEEARKKKLKERESKDAEAKKATAHEEFILLCKTKWNRLELDMKYHLQGLGFDEKSWKEKKLPPAFFLKWHELDERQLRAATELTYDESTWDNNTHFRSFTQKNSIQLTATKTHNFPRAAQNQNQNHTKNVGDNSDDDDDDDDSKDVYKQTFNSEEEDEDDDADDKGPKKKKKKVIIELFTFGRTHTISGKMQLQGLSSIELRNIRSSCNIPVHMLTRRNEKKSHL